MMTTTTKSEQHAAAAATPLRNGSFMPSRFLTTFCDRLLLLSPRTWFGVLKMLGKRPPAPWEEDAAKLVRAILAIVVPYAILRMLMLMLFPLLLLPTEFPFPIYLASPWTIHAVRQGYLASSTTWEGLRYYHVNRKIALPEALRTRRERLENSERGYAKRRYDVYLPPPLLSPPPPNMGMGNVGPPTRVVLPRFGRPLLGAMQKGMMQRLSVTDQRRRSDSFRPGAPDPPMPPKSVTPAILFIPGALVPHAAYAQAAARLSDDGFVVVVISAEPTRLPTEHLGADAATIRRIMSKVERRATTTTMKSVSFRWSLLGHSMGSFAACRLARTLGTEPAVRAVALWGMAAFPGWATDLSRCDVAVLIVQGSEDPVVAMSSSFQDEFDQCFPTQTTYRKVIQGGTHDGFASYRPRVEAQGDSETEERKSSREKQQRLACKWTSEFLLRGGGQ